MRTGLRQIWKQRARDDWRGRHEVTIGVHPDVCACGHVRGAHRQGKAPNPRRWRPERMTVLEPLHTQPVIFARTPGRSGGWRPPCTVEGCGCRWFRSPHATARERARRAARRAARAGTPGYRLDGRFSRRPIESWT